jgi:predicted dithiol-disulfide oxidoreductase (DUF899 family)
MDMPPIVSPQEWKAAREELLVSEKELTRARDALAAKRRRMPRMAVEKSYTFEGPNGKVGLLDLFEGRRQLIVYRFFYEPGVGGWPEKGCPGCSMVADQVAHPAHVNARDTTLVFVSRAPQEDIVRWRARMGWDLIPWYTLTDDFDADFDVDEWHGTNVFYRDDEDRVFRTYLVNGRGDEALGGLWAYLDITPLGRQEEWRIRPRATRRRRPPGSGATTSTTLRPKSRKGLRRSSRRCATRPAPQPRGARPRDRAHRWHAAGGAPAIGLGRWRRLAAGARLESPLRRARFGLSGTSYLISCCGDASREAARLAPESLRVLSS